MPTATEQKIRPLTNDEKKAAEAAFRGAPFQPTWSESARKIYQGISAAMANRSSALLSVSSGMQNERMRLDEEHDGPARSRIKSKIR